MIENNMKILAHKPPWSNSIELLIKDGESVATNIIMTKFDRDVYVDPSLKLSNESAQLLIDELWKAGLRPSEGTGIAGSLKATERHLEDMRTLVFKEIKQ